MNIIKENAGAVLQLLGATVVGLLGVWAYLEWGNTQEGIAFGLGGILTGGFIIFIGPGKKAALRFGRLKWDLRDLPQHILVTGATGSGKTVSSLHPVMVQLTKRQPDWGGMVLGAKGNEHEFVSGLLVDEKEGKRKKVVVVSVPMDERAGWEPTVRYNLLSNREVPWSTHAKLICDTASSLTPGEAHSFFGPASQAALEKGMQLLDELDRPVNIRSLFNLLTDANAMEEALDLLRDMSLPSQTRLELMSYFERTFLEAEASEQKEGLRGTIEKTLAFLMNDKLLKVISSESPNTFEISDVDLGFVICVSIPQQLAMERRFVNAYLKNLFYQHALNRLSLSSDEVDKKNFICLIADEFQELVTASKFGLSDFQIVDRVRSAKVAVIAATQSTRSFIPVIGRDNTNTLLDNLRTRFIFRETNEETAKESANYIGLKEKQEITRNMGGRASRSIRKVDKHIFKTTDLRKLKNHECVIVHANGKHQKLRIKPRNADGGVPSWYRGMGV